MRRVGGLGAAVALAFVLTGCPQPNEEGCGEPSDELSSTITDAVSIEGELRNFQAFQVDGSSTVFVSVEHRTPDEVDDDDSGDILTFAAIDGASDDVVAVDEHARTDTDLPHADFDVRETGAVDSRGCTYSARSEDDSDS
jgi:hypothetical protein